MQIKTTPKISSHPNWNGDYQERKQQQVLAWMWGERYTHTLLVGLQISAATLESSMEIPSKTWNGTTI